MRPHQNTWGESVTGAEIGVQKIGSGLCMAGYGK